MISFYACLCACVVCAGLIVNQQVYEYLQSNTHSFIIFLWVIEEPLLFMSYSLPCLTFYSTWEVIYASAKPLLSAVLYLSCFIILLLMLLLHPFPCRTENSVLHSEVLSEQLLYLCAFSLCWACSVFSLPTVKPPFSEVFSYSGVWMQYNVTVELSWVNPIGGRHLECQKIERYVDTSCLIRPLWFFESWLAPYLTFHTSRVSEWACDFCTVGQ